MRGEHKDSPTLKVTYAGSSPHARGAQNLVAVILVGFGIIPACAGSTSLICSALISSWDHPRMRGEHLGRGLGIQTIEGSSPHARGAQSLAVRVNDIQGIIPACAGSTSSRAS